jgi:sentrin-specific protease 1
MLSDKGSKDHVFYEYERVRRATCAKPGLDVPFLDVSTYDVIAFPVHLRVHWALCAIDVPGRTVHWYDSNLIPGGTAEAEYERVMRGVLRWLADELADKKRVQVDTAGWTRRVHAGVPQQGNGYDCGLFLVEFARALAVGKRIVVSQADMPRLRRSLGLTLAASRPDGSGLPGCAQPPTLL